MRVLQQSGLDGCVNGRYYWTRARGLPGWCADAGNSAWASRVRLLVIICPWRSKHRLDELLVPDSKCRPRNSVFGDTRDGQASRLWGLGAISAAS